MSRTYDSLGRLTAMTAKNGSGATLLSHGYTEFDAMDRRKKILREDGKEWRYDYNVRGEVTNAWKQFPAREGGEWLAGWQSTYAYDAIGNRVSAAAGGDGAGANLRTATYTANQLNQYVQRTVPGSIFFTGEASPAATVDVAVNEQSVSSVLRQGASGAKSFFSAEYQTDNSNLGLFGLIRVRASTTGNAPVGQLGSFYLQKSPEVFSYDLDGNLISDEQWTYTWDAENRLIAMETRSDRLRPAGPLPLERRLKLEFAYDAQGRRIQKQVWMWNIVTGAWRLSSDLRFVYDQWNCLADLAVQGATTTTQCSYAWGLDLSGSLYGAGGVGGLLAQSNSVAGVSGDYLHSYDGNGNVAGLINVANETLSAEYDYNAFGEVLKSVGAIAELNRYRFSSKYHDETGLNYYGYRYYSSSSGRWIDRDPYGEEGGVNLYQFVANAPNSWCDPLGLALYAFDGTNNDGDRDRWNNAKAENGPTNVRILHDVYVGNRYYAHGVGTRDGALNVFGLVGGLGGKSREGNALRVAEEFVQGGDTIADIIGFSRGAAQARDFANQLKQKFPCVTIRWMGIFDTVASFGLGGNDIDIGYNFRIPVGTGSVFHLTAGGERRHFFPLMSINVGPGQRNPNRSYTEISIPGAVHSDIGGGYRENRGLANFALVAMWRDAKRHDVPFEDIPAMYLNYAGAPHDSRWKNDKILEALIGGPRQRKIFYSP